MSRGMKEQKSTETTSTQQRESMKTPPQKVRFYQALRGLNKVPTPLEDSTTKG